MERIQYSSNLNISIKETSLEEFTSIGITLLRIAGLLSWSKHGWQRKLSTVYSACVLISVLINFLSMWAYIILKSSDINFWFHEIWLSTALISVYFQMISFLPKIRWLKNLIFKTTFYSSYYELDINLKFYKNKALVITIIHELLFLIPILSVIYNYFLHVFQFTSDSWLSWLIPNKFTPILVKIWCVTMSIFALIFQMGFSLLFIYILYFQQAFLDHLIGIASDALHVGDCLNLNINARSTTTFEAKGFVFAHIFLIE